VAQNEQEVRAKYSLDNNIKLKQDEDVLDTWFSSALWPFSTQGWPEKTDALKTFYPGSVLVTGYDIIFFWVARMIMFGTYFMDGEVPFKDVYMHGLVLDSNGKKMSKTKGNVLDPLDIIDGIALEELVEKRTSNMMQDSLAPKIAKQTRKDYPEGIDSYGTDALRFTFASLATNGRDIRFDLKRVEGYRNFCNKLYNATRYVLMNTEKLDSSNEPASYNAIDNWIISQLQKTEITVADHFAHYRFDLASTAIYEFVWNEYCDWYLELAKPVLTGNASDAEKHATRTTLVRVLEATLRLAHPIMPFITEELWQQVAPLAGKNGPSISLQPFPVGDTDKIDAKAVEEIEWVKRSVMGVRKIRAEMNINPGKKLPLKVSDANADDIAKLEKHGALLSFVARLSDIEILNPDTPKPDSAIALVDHMQLLIPMAGLIDKEAELARLGKEIDRLKSEVARLSAKLSNTGFTDKAPAKVVELEQQKLDDAQSALTQLQAQVEKISKL